MYRFINRAMAYLGIGLITLGIILFVIRQMSSDNPQNQPGEKINQTQPVATNDQPLTTPTSIPLPFNAYFAVFTNNTFRLFDAARYRNLDERVFIADGENPNKITVNASNITWGYFFDTLPMELNATCLTTGTGQAFCTNSNSTLRFFINGQEDGSALTRTINQNDRLLVTYGGTNAAQLTNQLQSLNDLD